VRVSVGVRVLNASAEAKERVVESETAFYFQPRRRGEVDIAQRGVCGRWTGEGDWLPCGLLNPFTKQTPHDNFVCDRCQREAHGLGLTSRCDFSKLSGNHLKL
jgi:hypothetical protein